MRYLITLIFILFSFSPCFAGSDQGHPTIGGIDGLSDQTITGSWEFGSTVIGPEMAVADLEEDGQWAFDPATGRMNYINTTGGNIWYVQLTDSGDGPTPPPATYTLTSSVTGDGVITIGGIPYSATGSPHTITGVSGDTPITASYPGSDDTLTWSGTDSADVTGSTPNYSITMDAAKSLSADFKTAFVSYQLEETFDGPLSCGSGLSTNCDTALIITSPTAITTNSTNGLPSGTYQMELGATTANARIDLSSTSGNATTYVTFRIRFEEIPSAAAYIVIGYDVGLNPIFSLNLDAGQHFWGDIDGGANLGDTTITATADTFYYVKLAYTADTGPVNASYQYWVSTDGTTWTDTVAPGTVDTTDNQIDNLRINNDNSAPYYIDNIKVDDEDITDAT